MDLMKRRREIMAQGNGLPSAYRRVEYLASSGTQYIQTNYIPQQYDELKTTFMITDWGNENFVLFSSGDGTYQLIYLGQINGYCKYFASGTASGINPNLAKSTWYTLTVSRDGVFDINHQTATSNYENSIDGSAKELRIMARQATPAKNYLRGKMSEFVISNNGVTKLNLIPCVRKSDSEAGMYDTVSKTFYTNAGTGEFITPPVDILSGATWIEGYFINDSGVVSQNLSGKYTETYVPVQAGKSYLITGTAEGTAMYDRIHGYNAQKAWQSLLYKLDWAAGAISSTITIPDGISYIRISTEVSTTISMFEV